MSITLRDCLQLPSLSLGRVIAGHGGLDRIVSTVSVMEFDSEDDESFVTPNELLISALYCVRDDVDAQCRMLRQSKENGDVGLVLFYADKILGSVDKRLIEQADLLDFPIILLPGEDMGLKYSDVINDVMEAVLYDRKSGRYFVSSAMERLSQLPEEKRTPAMLLRYAGDYGKASFFLCDRQYRLICASLWPLSNSGDLQLARKYVSAQQHSAHTEAEKGRDDNPVRFMQLDFSEKKSGELTLLAVSHNRILNPRILNEIAEALQLFAALWNYNLGLATKEAVIPALFDGRRETAARIYRDLGIDEKLYNRLTIAELYGHVEREQAEALLTRLRGIYSEEQEPLIAELLGTRIIMLSSGSAGARSQLLAEETEELLENSRHVAFYTGCMAGELDEISAFLREYASVRTAMEVIYPKRRKFSAENIHFVRRVRDIYRSSGEEKQYCCRLLEPITVSGEPELLQTLSCHLLDGGSHLSETARLLFVHRNTVLYRLNKVRALTGCDLNSMPYAYDLYMAVSLKRLEADEKSGGKDRTGTQDRT